MRKCLKFPYILATSGIRKHEPSVRAVEDCVATAIDCILLIIKANKMHNFSNVFDKVLYMFRTVPLSIIRSISTLYTRNRYLSCEFCRLSASVVRMELKYSTCFGHVDCPSSGVSQHCIHIIGTCHATSVGCLLAWSGWN